jgi:hypothetical protein
MTARSITMVAFLVTGTAAADAQSVRPVRIDLADGRVSISGEGVTAAQVLAVWAEAARFEVVGAELLSPNALTIAFRDSDELTALRILVGPDFQVSVVGRPPTDERRSRFEQVVVVPVSKTPARDPEQIYSYFVSDKGAAAEPRQNITPVTPAEDPVPERRYSYYVPPDQDAPLLQPAGPQVEQPAGDPETRFKYYAKPLPDKYAEYKNEALKVPILPDPELRFKYYIGEKSIKPRDHER